VARFNDFLGRQPHPHKVVIAGNHDWAFALTPRRARALITHATYLEDAEATVAGLRIWGSPWQPEFMDWAFNLPPGEPLRQKWDLIPDGVDVLITHGPPRGHGDALPNGARVGCPELLAAVRRVRPRLHVFGHIHEGYGVTRDEHTTYVNASTCTLSYAPTNAPVVIDL
jgi:predicted phosphohydrolase